MRIFARSTSAPGESTPVAAETSQTVTLGTGGTFRLRRQCENPTHPIRRTGQVTERFTSVFLRAVTSSHKMTSPGSGAVVASVMKLTCSAISYPSQAGR